MLTNRKTRNKFPVRSPVEIEVMKVSGSPKFWTVKGMMADGRKVKLRVSAYNSAEVEEAVKSNYPTIVIDSIQRNRLADVDRYFGDL